MEQALKRGEDTMFDVIEKKLDTAAIAIHLATDIQITDQDLAGRLVRWALEQKQFWHQQKRQLQARTARDRFFGSDLEL